MSTTKNKDAKPSEPAIKTPPPPQVMDPSKKPEKAEEKDKKPYK